LALSAAHGKTPAGRGAKLGNSFRNRKERKKPKGNRSQIGGWAKPGGHVQRAPATQRQEMRGFGSGDPRFDSPQKHQDSV